MTPFKEIYMHKNLRSFMDQLRKEKEIVEVKAEVDQIGRAHV